MKIATRTIGALVAVTFLLSVCSAAYCAESKLKPGSKAPNFTLKDMSGKTYKLAAFRNKRVVVLDFGRFICEPCRVTMKNLQKLQAKYKNKGVQILAVNLDGAMAAEKVPEAIKELGLTYPVLLDTEYKTFDAYKGTLIPYVVVVDTKGIVRYAHTGFEADLTTKLPIIIEKHRPPMEN
ncbi:MAG: TlpA family protein disulfide reductase [Phycisphaerae bacterium]|nr:TlpA family protein disulfide reductase [Phycisphaerae bacterium]